MREAWLTGGPKYPREDHDFYATRDTRPVHALLDLWQPLAPVWECACGDGAMVAPLRARGLEVIATDLIDRGCSDGRGGVDFLSQSQPLAPVVITNPPFKLAEDFVRHGAAIGLDAMALLLPADWFAVLERGENLFVDHPPAAWAPLTRRICWTGQGQPTGKHAWGIWSWSGPLALTRQTPCQMLPALMAPKPRKAAQEEAA